jgi:LAGLIDADG-like domain
VPAARKIYGRTQPRLWTPPLRPLSKRTSNGYAAAEFAEAIGEPFLPWQRWLAIHAMELLPDLSYRFRVVLVLVARQNGKALDCSVDILTANRGWATVGDLVVGDEVFHPDGYPVRVIATHPVRRDRPCYRVTTTDDRSIVVDAEHLWTVQDRRRVTKKGRRGERPVRTYPWETLTTAQLLERGLMRGARECAYRLPRQHALVSKSASLPIDPYLLGQWLGDGNSASATISVGAKDVDETVAAIEAAGARIVSRRRDHTAWRIQFSTGPKRSGSGFQSRCIKLGIWGNKHIPEIYLTAGAHQRLALLQGLLDTDGSIYVGGGGSARVEFCSVSHRLADGVLYLARSLGWRATLLEARATLNGRDCGPKYRVCFTPQQGELAPFRLARKAAKVQAPRSRNGERHAVSIRSIEPVESRPVRCITVDREDGLFLAGRDLIATHNSTGKRTISLWRLHVDGARLVLGVAQDLGLAREQWQMCLDTIQASPDLSTDLGQVRRVNGDEWFRIAASLGGDPDERELSFEDDELDESLTLAGGGRYKIAASNRKAGRGLSVDELNIDELREQRSWQAWSALSKTTMARPLAQIWCMSNAGDDESVVLNQLRDAALSGRDPSIGLFEWSAPDDCELDDLGAIRQANPGLGYTVSLQAIRTAQTTDPPAVYRTEVLCQKVDQLDGAIDFAAWKACHDPRGTMEGLRARLAFCFDAAPDGRHATLAAAARLDDGRVRVEIMQSWDSTEEARAELRGLLARNKPAAIGWYPAGPAAELASILRPAARTANHRPGKRRPQDEWWLPETGEITGTKVPEVCQELAGIVRARRIVQPGDPLLDSHIKGAAKLASGDGWRFTRKGDGHCDAAYAAAGAAGIALTMPAPRRAQIRSVG